MTNKALVTELLDSVIASAEASRIGSDDNENSQFAETSYRPSTRAATLHIAVPKTTGAEPSPQIPTTSAAVTVVAQRSLAGPQPHKRLDKAGLAAKKKASESDSTHVFWTNRLNLLRKEVEEARIKAHMRRLEDNHHESSALSNQTTASQLKVERQQVESMRLERVDAIRLQREHHKKAFKASLHQTVATKMAESRQMKQTSEMQRSMVIQLREEVLANKRATRQKIMDEKARAAEERRKEKLVRAEKARRLYEIKIENLEVEAERKDTDTRQLVEESGRLLEQLRRLQHLEGEGVDGSPVLGSDIERACRE